MCRIVGVCYGPDGPEAEEWTPNDMAQMMLPAAVCGGPHAWGWMSYSGREEIEVYKAQGRADTKVAIKSMNVAADSHWWIGHTRFFTHGSPSVMLNNHPVCHGNIIGVHNGVIRNYEEVLKKTGRHNHGTDEAPLYSEVDSESIFAAVHASGHKKGLERITGDMVSVYVDVRYPEIVRFARTIGRDLYLSQTPGGALVFGSQPEFITNTGIECTEPSPLSSYRMLSVKAGKITRRVNLARPITYRSTPAVRQSGLRVFESDPNSTRGITDRMTPPTSPADVKRRQRAGTAAAWNRGQYHSANPSTMFSQPQPQLMPPPAPAISPLGRKAQKLRDQIREATIKATGQEPRLTKMTRVPSQALKRQENGTFNVEHGLYWHDGVMVDLNTYVECLVHTITKGATA